MMWDDNDDCADDHDVRSIQGDMKSRKKLIDSEAVIYFFYYLIVLSHNQLTFQC